MLNYTLSDIQKSTIDRMKKMSIDRMSQMKMAVLALSLYMFINPYKKVIYRVIY